MSKEKEESEIDRHKVITHQMDPLKLYPMVPRIAQMAFPILGQIGELAKLARDPKAIEAYLTNPKNLERLTPVLVHIAKELGKPENANLPVELLQRTQIDILDHEGKVQRIDLGSAAAVSLAFRGKFLTMLKCMWFAARLNFSDFFGGGSSEDPSKVSMVPPASPSA